MAIDFVTLLLNFVSFFLQQMTLGIKTQKQHQRKLNEIEYFLLLNKNSYH